jgi:hypothetical protein
MLRIFLILSVGLLISCKNSSLKTEKFNNTNTWSIDTIKYTAYRILYNQKSEWYTRIDHFLRVDNNGNYLVAKKKDHTIEFFKGQVPYTLLRLIDTTLGSMKSGSSYTYNPEHGYIYDGNTYLIDIQIGGKRKFIDFIPPEAPKQLQHLRVIIDNFIYSVDKEQIAKYDLSYYENETLRIDKRTRVKPPATDSSHLFKPIQIRNENR